MGTEFIESPMNGKGLTDNAIRLNIMKGQKTDISAQASSKIESAFD